MGRERPCGSQEVEQKVGEGGSKGSGEANAGCGERLRLTGLRAVVNMATVMCSLGVSCVPCDKCTMIHGWQLMPLKLSIDCRAEG